MTAQTNAQRQANYRKNRSTKGENIPGEQRINIFVSKETTLALECLAKNRGVTKRKILEEIILAANHEKTVETKNKLYEFDSPF